LWTDGGARRVLAVIAAMDAELASYIRINALFDVLHVCPVDPYRYIVLRLTGDCAGMTTYALAIVYHEAVVDHGPPSMRADRPSWQMSLRYSQSSILAIPAAAIQVPATEPRLPIAVTMSTFPTRFFQNKDRSFKSRNSWASPPVGGVTFNWV